MPAPVAPPDVVERLPGARSLFEAYLSKLLAGVLASSPNVVLYSPADALCPTQQRAYNTEFTS